MDIQIKSYLRRIKFDGIPENNYATLRRLQNTHLKTVPYENLDIMRGIPISLEIKDLYKKIVTNRRGGYCFELNGLFTWLLRRLGFKVKEHMARYLRYETETPMRKHRVLTVTVKDTNYLCDVGMGASIPLFPLPLILGKVNKQKDAHYKFEKEDFLGTVLYEWKNSRWRRIYSFTEEEQLNIDYIMPSFYCENHPQSYFRTMDMVHIFTDNGRKAIAKGELKIYSPKETEVIVPGSEEIYKKLLNIHFGISL